MAATSKVNPELEKSLIDALKQVGTKGAINPETDKPYTLTDKCKVWDRVLKLEGLKAKLNEGDWASGFADE